MQGYGSGGGQGPYGGGGGGPSGNDPTGMAPSQGGYGPGPQPGYQAGPGQGYGAPPQGPPGYAPGMPPGGGYGGPPPGVQGGMGGMGGTGTYEFNDYENSVLMKTAGRAKTWAIVSIVMGILTTMSGCGFVAKPDLLLNFPTGIVAIIVGVMFLGVANSLQSVAQTQGNDLAHMMQALDKLGGAFLTQTIVSIIGFVLMILCFILVMFVLAAAAVAGA